MLLRLGRLVKELLSLENGSLFGLKLLRSLDWSGWDEISIHCLRVALLNETAPYHILIVSTVLLMLFDHSLCSSIHAAVYA